MMHRFAPSLAKYPLLYMVAYLSLLAVMVVELVVRPATSSYGWVAGLLVAFGLLLALKPYLRPHSWQTHLFLAAQTAIVTGTLTLQPGSEMLPMLFCVLGVIAALALPLRSVALWITTFIIINTVHCAFAPKWDHNILVSLPYAVGYIFCGTFAYSLAQTAAARQRSEQLLAELQVAHDHLQKYNTRLEELVVSQERNRLAREMHDAIGHRLTVAAVQLEGAERLIPTDPGKAGRMVHTVHQQVVEALAELRRTVATLRTPLEVDLSLLSALTRLASGFEEATGITVNRMLPEELPSLPDTHRLALQRAAQEALTNVQRHAQAKQVWLELTLEPEAISLLVKDDGRGFVVDTASQHGFGLRGMQERAAHLNGAFHLNSTPGAGSQICFHLPLPPDISSAPVAGPALKPRPWKLMCPLGSYACRPEKSSALSTPSS
jgi:signal transduction histidine kinase